MAACETSRRRWQDNGLDGADLLAPGKAKTGTQMAVRPGTDRAKTAKTETAQVSRGPEKMVRGLVNRATVSKAVARREMAMEMETGKDRATPAMAVSEGAGVLEAVARVGAAVQAQRPLIFQMAVMMTSLLVSCVKLP